MFLYTIHFIVKGKFVDKDAKNKAINSAVNTCFNYYFKPNSKQTTQKHLSFPDFLNARIPSNSCFSFPHTVFIETTSQCNLRCKHCLYTRNEDLFSPNGDFTTAEIIKLSDFLIEEVGVINFIIFGREPLLTEGFFEIIEFLKSKNVYLKIQTNALLLTDETTGFLKDILNSKTDSLQVSLDGVSEDVHEKIRGKGTYKKTIKSIKRLTGNNINVEISYTVNSFNVIEIPELYELSNELKVKQISLGRFEPAYKEQNYLIPDKTDVIIALTGLIEKIEKNTGTNLINLELSVLKTFSFLDFKEGRKLLDKYLAENNISDSPKLKCHRDDRITISAKGEVYLCPNAITDSNEFSLGNLKKQSFYEVWENRFENIFFKEKCYDKSICNKCSYLKLCDSGCPSNAYFKYGSISAPDSYCNYADKLKRSE